MGENLPDLGARRSRQASWNHLVLRQRPRTRARAAFLGFRRCARRPPQGSAAALEALSATATHPAGQTSPSLATRTGTEVANSDERYHRTELCAGCSVAHRLKPLVLLFDDLTGRTPGRWSCWDRCSGVRRRPPCWSQSRRGPDSNPSCIRHARTGSRQRHGNPARTRRPHSLEARELLGEAADSVYGRRRAARSTCSNWRVHRASRAAAMGAGSPSPASRFADRCRRAVGRARSAFRGHAPGAGRRLVAGDPFEPELRGGDRRHARGGGNRGVGRAAAPRPGTPNRRARRFRFSPRSRRRLRGRPGGMAAAGA